MPRQRNSPLRLREREDYFDTYIRGGLDRAGDQSEYRDKLRNPSCSTRHGEAPVYLPRYQKINGLETCRVQDELSFVP